MRAVFFGTPHFAARILAFLIEKKVEIAAVVTQPPKATGRRAKTASAVKDCAKNLLPETPVFEPEKASAPEFIAKLRSLRADIFIVAAYGQILKKELIDLPQYGTINVHASLLPKYRGAAPLQRALMAGEKESGVTIMQIAVRLDAGDMLAAAKTKIEPEDNYQKLEEKLIDLSGPLLISVLEDLQRGLIRPMAQDESMATYAAKILPLECEIDWKREAIAIHNQIRALSPQPGAVAMVEFNGEKKHLKIKKARVCELGGPPGSVLEQNKILIIACGQGALEILEVQPESKRDMPIKNFLGGLRAILKIIL